MSPELVKAIVYRILNDVGLVYFTKWQERVEDQLHNLRVIISDIQDAVALVESSNGSTRSQMNELLMLLGKATQNIEGILEDRDKEVSESAITSIAELRRANGVVGDSAELDADMFDDPMDDLL